MATTAMTLRALLEQYTRPAAPELAHREKDGIRCYACGHRCFIREGKAGVCRVRFNRNGELRVPAGYVAGLQVDPIEKKPFFHVLPGQAALSFGMLGCDLHCSYCQNWVTSQALRDDTAISNPRFVTAQDLVNAALQYQCPVMVSTYNEPLITSEWAVEVFSRAKKVGLLCGYVSNGNATPEVLNYLRPYVDLYKVDLKTFNDKNYRALGCTLSNVLESIHRIHAMGFWLEIVTLIVPGFNDSEDELRQMAKFIADISPDVPWHVTAFHPDYKMTEPRATTANDLQRAYEIGKSAGLHFVYAGNRPGELPDAENTYCPHCGTLLIQRYGFYVNENRMRGDLCPNCETRIPGVWEKNPPRSSKAYGFPQPL
jgi:pyruvate formate lyase activating enzyme